MERPIESMGQRPSFLPPSALMSAFTNSVEPLRIGIIDHHDDFTRIILSLIPRHHEVIIYPSTPMPPADRVNGAVDFLINHHDKWFNDRYEVPTIVQPYATVTSTHVKQWNADPKIIGVLDMSSTLTAKFPQLRVPVFAFTPTHPHCLTYEKAGDKVITLILNYEKRFPIEFAISTFIADEMFGADNNNQYRTETHKVRDIDALKDAKWLLHIKHDGFVCNAVMKALACGVPVIMDDKTFINGAYEGILRHDHNAIILPAHQLKEFLTECPAEQYDRIKRTCVEEAQRWRRPLRWCDGWWRSIA